MWISNTATTAMMFPIGLSIVTHLSSAAGWARHPRFRRFAMTMMLMTAFGASIGGMATPIGTPPNLIGIGMLRELPGVEISFFRWMVLGRPAGHRACTPCSRSASGSSGREASGFPTRQRASCGDELGAARADVRAASATSSSRSS